MGILEILHKAKKGIVKGMELLYVREEKPETQFWLMGVTKLVFRTRVQRDVKTFFEDARKELDKMNSYTLENRNYGLFVSKQKRKAKSQLKKNEIKNVNEDYEQVKEQDIRRLTSYKNGRIASLKYEAYSQRNHVQGIKCKLGEFIRGYKLELRRNESHKLPTLSKPLNQKSKDWKIFLNVSSKRLSKKDIFHYTGSNKITS